MMETQIPFHGFYESKWSQGIDDAEELVFDEESEYDQEIIQKMDIWRYANYCWMYQNVAVEYVKAFNAWFKDAHGVDLELQFVEMTSPREYNFTTDRIFAKFPDEKFDQLMELVDMQKLAEEMEKRHRSRDGFISFYSWHLSDWMEQLKEDKFVWDANQVHTLLQAIIDDEYDEYEWGIYEDMHSNGLFHEAFEEHFDWETFKEDYDALLSEQAEENESADA